MTTYKVIATVQVWGSVIPIPYGKRAILGPGLTIESTWGRLGYAFIESPAVGYVSYSCLSEIVESPTPPLPDPDPSDVVNLRWTIPGNKKPRGYLPGGINYGSFDIGWLLPKTIASKPPGFNFSRDWISYIFSIQSGSDTEKDAKVRWLIDQAGTRRVLSVNEAGVYRCPVPCWSGSNPVRVLEYSGSFARIQTVNINKPMPEVLPSWLCHTWWAFTRLEKGGKYYQPLGAIGAVKYPLLWTTDSAWIQVKGLQ